MTFRTHVLEAKGIRAVLDLDLGQIAELSVIQGGRTVSPWARVPWADDPPGCTAIHDAPHLARMSCDFFCAPFCAADVEQAPPHGWSANSAWDLISETKHDNGIEAIFRLRRSIMNATVEKHWRLIDNSPFLYQSHVFRGGSGRLPVAHHAMVDMRQGGVLRLSPRSSALTPPTPLETDPERGRSILAYPAKSHDLHRFPTADGGTSDLTRYPLDMAHEDFVMLVDEAAPHARDLAWTLALRPADQDAAILIKDPVELPQTMLWYSNGGRHYPPWSGRHVGVLGIEDACAYSLEGHAASISPNPLAAKGVPTAISLNPAGEVRIRHAMGAIALGAASDPPEGMTIEEDAVRLTGMIGKDHAAHFWRGHFTQRAA